MRVCIVNCLSSSVKRGGMELKRCAPLTVIVLIDYNSEEQRERFFRDLLNHVVPAEEDGISVLFENAVALTPVSAEHAVFTRQLAWFWSEFRGWDNQAKNALINSLESIDLPRVYQFYEAFSHLRMH